MQHSRDDNVPLLSDNSVNSVPKIHLDPAVQMGTTIA